MKKKTTVLLALISMCLIVTAGIGAVTASDEPVCTVTLGKINLDSTVTVLEIFESSGPLNVTVTQNEDGSVDTFKNGIRIPEEELCGGLYIDNCLYIYPEEDFSELVNMIGEGVISADTLKPPEKIDVSVRAVFYSQAPVSASDELAVTATVSKKNWDETTTPIKTFESHQYQRVRTAKWKQL